jgi:DNA-binding HxlR family transcriptional regulator
MTGRNSVSVVDLGRVRVVEKEDAVSAVRQPWISLRPESDQPRARRPEASDREVIEHVEQALDVLKGKWTVQLLFCMARGVHRHNRLLDSLPGASKKVLTDTLRALERDGLVDRQIFAEVPVRVEYSLTALGWTTTDPLVVLSDWSQAHAEEVVAARSRYEARVARQAPYRSSAFRTPDSGAAEPAGWHTGS